MNKKPIIISHANHNNESWVERELKRANEVNSKPRLLLDETDNWDGRHEPPVLRLAMEREATGGIVTGDCPDCRVKGSMVFSLGLGRCYCTHCSYSPTHITIKKTHAMGKSEAMFNGVMNTGY